MIKAKEFWALMILRFLHVFAVEWSNFCLDDMRSYSIFTVADSVLYETTWASIISDLILIALFFAFVSRRILDEKRNILSENRKTVVKKITADFLLFSLVNAVITTGTCVVISRGIFGKKWINWDAPVSTCRVYNDFYIIGVSVVEVLCYATIFWAVISMINLGVMFIVKVITNNSIYSLISAVALDCVLGWGIKGLTGRFFRFGYYSFKYSNVGIGNALIYLSLFVVVIIAMYKVYERKEWL